MLEITAANRGKRCLERLNISLPYRGIKPPFGSRTNHVGGSADPTPAIRCLVGRTRRMTQPGRFHKYLLATASVIAALSLSAWPAEAGPYVQTNLVSDMPGLAKIPSQLVNPWGISHSATSPFWISNQGTSTANLRRDRQNQRQQSDGRQPANRQHCDSDDGDGAPRTHRPGQQHQYLVVSGHEWR